MYRAGVPSRGCSQDKEYMIFALFTFKTLRQEAVTHTPFRLRSLGNSIRGKNGDDGRNLLDATHVGFRASFGFADVGDEINFLFNVTWNTRQFTLLGSPRYRTQKRHVHFNGCPSLFFLRIVYEVHLSGGKKRKPAYLMVCPQVKPMEV